MVRHFIVARAMTRMRSVSLGEFAGGDQRDVRVNALAHHLRDAVVPGAGPVMDKAEGRWATAWFRCVVGNENSLFF